MEITQESFEKGQNLFHELVKNAWDNTAFKEQLIASPKSVITEISGSDLSQLKDKNIVVEDQTNSNFIYLNIPKKISLDSFELTEDQLEAISGGDSCPPEGNNPISHAAYWVTKGIVEFDLWLGELVFG